MNASINQIDVAIIGAGPAGLFAAFECNMLKMSCLLIDALDVTGGQCSALYPEKPIYDIPAHPAITGADLIASLEKQIEGFAVPRLLGQTVIALEGTPGQFTLRTNANTLIHAKAVIIAAGAGAFGPNRPPLEHIEQYEATGCIHYYVRKRSDFDNKHLVIGGGGDSAIDWALALKDTAASVTLVHRRDRFRAAPESLAKLEKAVEAGKICKAVPFQLHALHGENGHLTGVEIIDLSNQSRILPADHLLAFFGLATDLGPIAHWDIECTSTHIPVIPNTCETSKAGVFAIGDIAVYPGKLKLILQGFSEAAMAAHAIYPIVFPGTALHFEYSTSKKMPDTHS